MREQGYSLSAWVVRFKAHCRRFCNSSEAAEAGLPWEKAACKKMAELTGENLVLIEAVYRGDHAPTKAILTHMGWIKYDTFEIVQVRKEVAYYLPVATHSQSTTNRSINPLY